MRIVRYIPVLTSFCAIAIAALGLTVIVGWYAHIIPLIQIHSTWVPMQFNTALGFVCLGLGLLSVNCRYPTLTKVLALLVVILGGLTLSQYLTGMSWGIDQLFMQHYITVKTISPGRMAPNTALCFTLSGIGLIMLVQSRWLPGAAMLGALVMGLGTVALLGYLSRVEAVYGWGQWTRMAIHTAIGFIIVGLTIVLQEQHFHHNGNYRSPPFVWSWVVGITGATVTVSFWQALYHPPQAISQLGLERLEEYQDNLDWVPFGVLVFGLAFSLTLSITVWFVGQFQAQIFALQQAQIKILELNEQLEQMCYIDGLTGIANRRMFDLSAERELRRAHRHQTPIALIVFDIDYFKDYNDFYGHLQGDECLRQVAQVIQSMAHRPSDLAARYGGEEFILLLPEADLQGGRTIAENILHALEALRIPHGQSPVSEWVSISAGVTAGIPCAGKTAEDLFIQSDKALYQAKQQGRGRVVACAFETMITDS